jgi:uncharacterized phage protein (TIGR02218 family)
VRAIPSTLQAKLNSGVTTLARCWIITRRDGVTMGFTDHDADLAVAGTLCHAGTGLTASEATARLGLQIAGRYDAAGIEVHLVDWSEPGLNVLLAKGVLGEVRREGAAFSAELRSLAHRLNEESGRLYTATCSADLGDARCTVDLTNPAFHGSGAIAALAGTSAFHCSGLDGFVDGWFTAGKLIFTSGANDGYAVEVKTHRVALDGVLIELWQQAPEPIAVADTFTVTAGCDKRFSTCRDRFGNSINFRGFPAIPGNDFVISYPVPGKTTA